jgi:hypothetical protein
MTCRRCHEPMAGGSLEDEGPLCWACVVIEGRENDAHQLTGGLLHWRYDAARRVLVHQHPHSYGYEVDVERCNTPAAVLDWIAQVAGKTWALEQPECIGELVIALDTLFHLQAILCPFGQARRIDATAVLTARARELGLTTGALP